MRNIDTPQALLYHTYNSLFLSLPFKDIEETGTFLSLFAQRCKKGLAEGMTPSEIVHTYWGEHHTDYTPSERLDLLFRFIQYTERQIVLFDAVEDALFEQTHRSSNAGSLSHLMDGLQTEQQQEVFSKRLEEYAVRLVLTAHPTQFYPGNVLAIINDLGEAIKANRLEQIRLLLMQLGKTAFVKREKPTPYDEAVSLGWYLENVFYKALPDIIEEMLRRLEIAPSQFSNPGLLSLGFWPGGDRDGNPFVDTATTLTVARRLRESILRCYYRDIRQLRRRLTFRGVEDIILRAETRINNTLYYPDQPHYQGAGELLADLMQARELLRTEHGNLFGELLERFILNVRIFGFHFAGLDIRQDSRKHGEVWEEIRKVWHRQDPAWDASDWHAAEESVRINALFSCEKSILAEDLSDGFAQETIRSMQAIEDIQAHNGEKGCHRYIISNCQSALHVAEALSMIRCSWGLKPDRQVSVDIVPLFETVDDLAAAGTIMEQLYTHPAYHRHLEARGMRQTIMLGFSDGTKDGGYLRANWSIYRAKAALSAVAQRYGVSLTFFDGRGGPPGRGGGNNTSFYASQGPEISNNGIQVTIQGQTVSSTYGTVASARFHIDRLLAAGLGNNLVQTPSSEWQPADMQLMEQMASLAYDAYLDLKHHPDFVPYLEHMTPLKWYGATNIGSRPTKRGKDSALRFEDLRAIPFVGAWAQMKQNIPGYFGFGTALEKLMSDEKARKSLQDLYRRSLFFRTLVENSMQALSKSNFEATRFIARHERFGPFWQILEEEYQRTDRCLKELSQTAGLSELNPASYQSIGLREEIVLPLIVLQQYGLQQLDAISRGDQPEESLEFYRMIVLRAMFGIINAARNAA